MGASLGRFDISSPQKYFFSLPTLQRKASSATVVKEKIIVLF
jgi:hypothetical protein